MTGMQGGNTAHSLSGYAPVSHLPPLKPASGALPLDSGHQQQQQHAGVAATAASPADMECSLEQQQQQARHDWNEKAAAANSAWKYQSFQVL